MSCRFKLKKLNWLLSGFQDKNIKISEYKMKKHSKILSAIGVALAAAFGIVGVATTPVSAVDPNAGSSTEVTVEVVVVGDLPGVTISRPTDGAVMIGLEFPVTTIYTDASKLVYELTFVANDGTQTTYNLPEVTLSTSGVTSGTHSFTINAEDYGGEYGDYILTVRADGIGATTDSTSFKLLAFDVAMKGYEEKTKNPIAVITNSDDVYKALLQVIDKDGKTIFDEPLEVILEPDGETEVVLPFDKYGVPNGEYTLIATGYDINDEIIGPSRSVKFLYQLDDTPDVPNTGSILGIINFSRSDVASTGIALFGVSAFFAILFIIKRSRRDQKR